MLWKCPSARFVGDVIFHACSGVDFKFAWVNGASEFGMVASCIFAFAIAFGIVNMLGLCER